MPALPLLVLTVAFVALTAVGVRTLEISDLEGRHWDHEDGLRGGGGGGGPRPRAPGTLPV
eukprot:COSAG06_NODE_518_length_14769_cov_75.390048_15_plen_59_part_01